MTAELAAQLPELERQADEFERKAAALRQIIQGVRALNGSADAILRSRAFAAHKTLFELGSAPPDAPRGRDAVRRVMGEDPGRLWKVVDLKKEILRRGWAPTPKAVEGSVARLREDGEIESPRYGFYRLAETSDPHSSGNGAQ